MTYTAVQPFCPVCGSGTVRSAMTRGFGATCVVKTTTSCSYVRSSNCYERSEQAKCNTGEESVHFLFGFYLIRGGSRILEKGGLFMNNDLLKRGRVRDGDPARPARGSGGAL